MSLIAWGWVLLGMATVFSWIACCALSSGGEGAGVWYLLTVILAVSGWLMCNWNYFW